MNSFCHHFCLFLICIGHVSQSSPAADGFLPDNQQFDRGSIRTSIDAYKNTNFRAGKVFETVYEWKVLDFLYETVAKRAYALAKGDFIPEHNVPLGLDAFRGRLFITTPRWAKGVPASLSFLSSNPAAQNETIPLQPFPNWEFHTNIDKPDCNKLLSAHRIQVDDCQRLWVLDAGVVGLPPNVQQLCPPKVMIFDLNTDALLTSYSLPPEQVKEHSLYTNILVDTRKEDCDDAFAYLFDVKRFGLTVFSLSQNTSWLTTSHLYYPDPAASDFLINDLRFQISDGIFGASLTDVNAFDDKLMFYHPLSSNAEFFVSTSILRNQSLWSSFEGQAEAATAFNRVGSRGSHGQSSTSGISQSGIQFYTQIQRSSVGCWDMEKPYTKENLGVVEENLDLINFPNDIKLDHEERMQNLWVLTNNLPQFLFSELDFEEVNFRVLKTTVDKAVAGTVCDPKQPHVPVRSPSYQECLDSDYFS